MWHCEENVLSHQPRRLLWCWRKHPPHNNWKDLLSISSYLFIYVSMFFFYLQWVDGGGWQGLLVAWGEFLAAGGGQGLVYHGASPWRGSFVRGLHQPPSSVTHSRGKFLCRVKFSRSASSLLMGRWPGGGLLGRGCRLDEPQPLGKTVASWAKTMRMAKEFLICLSYCRCRFLKFISTEVEKINPKATNRQ